MSLGFWLHAKNNGTIISSAIITNGGDNNPLVFILNSIIGFALSLDENNSTTLQIK